MGTCRSLHSQLCYPSHLLLLLIHCGLLVGERAARRGALGGELIAIGIMSAKREKEDQHGEWQHLSHTGVRTKLHSPLLLLLLLWVAARRIHPRVGGGRHEIRLWGPRAHIPLRPYSRVSPKQIGEMNSVHIAPRYHGWDRCQGPCLPHSVIRTSIGIVLSWSHSHISQTRPSSTAIGVTHPAVGALP
jgi:hypothetical protein